jgi:hypothetical protein
VAAGKSVLAKAGVALLVAAAPVGVYLAPDDSGPSYPERWDPRVSGLVSFVERERGLAFEHPVEVSFLSDAEFREKVTTPEEDKEAEEEELKRFLGELRAVGLVSGDPDLGAAADELLGDSIVGLYVPEEEALYVRGQQLTPYVEGVLVHELTHALQDQHFDLERMDERAPRGAEVATRALVEGDADRIEDLWVAALAPSEQEAYARAEQEADTSSGGSGADVPQVLQDLLSFPYAFGPADLDSLGDNARIDAAFRRPPVSEAQVVDPLRYGASFEPAEVDDPELPEGAKASDEPGAFGQFTLFSVLGARLGQARAWEAVSGWSGDRYTSYRQDGRDCLAVDVSSRDTPHAGALESALREWQVDLPYVDLALDGRTVRLRACDPGAGVTRTEVTPRAFEVMAGRAEVVHSLVRQTGIGFRTASCVVDGTLRAIGPSVFVQDELTPAEQQQVQSALQAAYQRC